MPRSRASSIVVAVIVMLGGLYPAVRADTYKYMDRSGTLVTTGVGSTMAQWREPDGVVITAGNVITPTAQNLANLEADMRAFAPTVAHLPEEEFVLRIEQLVRAYDPCISCATHFLKLDLREG